MDEATNGLTGSIIGCAMTVHRELGPGLLESVYDECLALLLSEAGHEVERQGCVPVVFRDRHLDHGFRFDLLVAKRVLVEVKAVEQLLPIHKAQVITYLKLTRLDVGLLINFNVPVLAHGVHRLINPRPAHSEHMP
jgi:GxxExxY protein